MAYFLDLLPYFWIAHQTGHWNIGLVIVAKLICHAKVEADHSGSKTANAELAMGFHSVKMELWQKAKEQNMPSTINLVYNPCLEIGDGVLFDV